MGTSHSIKCNSGASYTWKWCIGESIWVSVERIAGKCNIATDKESREIDTTNEWMLNPALLQQALDKLQVYTDV